MHPRCFYFSGIVEVPRAFIILTETKVAGEEANNIMNRLNFENSAKVDVDGASGGLYALWNNDLSVQTIAQSPQELYLFIKVKNHTQPFFLSAVYSRPYASFKSLIWDNLKSFCDNHKNSSLLVLGDFNEISSPSEKFGGLAPSPNRMLKIKENIDDCNLMDLWFSRPRLPGPIFVVVRISSWNV